MFEKPALSLSLDLDDLWTYLKTHGDASWRDFPSYLHYAIPRILDFMDEEDIKLTFFIVAQDAAFDRNRDLLAEIGHRGHDIGNHTFHHDPWLHEYSYDEINEEIALAEEHIERVTGVLPKGFRGPGFSFSNSVLRVLMDRDYKYDASTFPNILNPVARLYFLRRSKLSREERIRRKALFGSWVDGFRPNKPFRWCANNQHLLEIPVTTMPIFKVPIHASYILYLSTYSIDLALNYLRFALFLCGQASVRPSILLHPLDFIGVDDTDKLSFFPAMRVERSQKIEVMRSMFNLLKDSHQPMMMSQYSDLVLHETELPLKIVKRA